MYPQLRSRRRTRRAGERCHVKEGRYASRRASRNHRIEQNRVVAAPDTLSGALSLIDSAWACMPCRRSSSLVPDTVEAHLLGALPDLGQLLGGELFPLRPWVLSLMGRICPQLGVERVR